MQFQFNRDSDSYYSNEITSYNSSAMLAGLRTKLLLFAIDMVSTIIDYYAMIGVVASIFFTVTQDPFNYAQAQIPTFVNRELRSFVVGVDCNSQCVGRYGYICTCMHEYKRRVVAWFYRWHDTPDADDWAECITRFKLLSVPSHKLVLSDGEAVIVEIDIGFNKSMRRVYSESCDLDDIPEYSRIPIGGLLPGRLISDARAQVCK